MARINKSCSIRTQKCNTNMKEFGTRPLYPNLGTSSRIVHVILDCSGHFALFWLMLNISQLYPWTSLVSFSENAAHFHCQNIIQYSRFKDISASHIIPLGRIYKEQLIGIYPRLVLAWSIPRVVWRVASPSSLKFCKRITEWKQLLILRIW